MWVQRAVVLAAVTVVGPTTLGATTASAQVPRTLHEFGAPVAPMLEGWYQNPDGTATVLVGFFNPNSDQTVDLPVGELNHFSPGPEDRGQPTHFPLGRSWGVLTIELPDDFDGDLSWTLTANNQPATIPLRLRHSFAKGSVPEPGRHREQVDDIEAPQCRQTVERLSHPLEQRAVHRRWPDEADVPVRARRRVPGRPRSEQHHSMGLGHQSVQRSGNVARGHPTGGNHLDGRLGHYSVGLPCQVHRRATIAGTFPTAGTSPPSPFCIIGRAGPGVRYPTGQRALAHGHRRSPTSRVGTPQGRGRRRRAPMRGALLERVGQRDEA